MARASNSGSENPRRLASVYQAVRAAEALKGCETGLVNLIAVSKTYQPSDITPVLEAGQRQFGENRVQEALLKWPDLKVRYANSRLHLIGPLQTNKVRDAVGLFDVIHTLDRPKLARALAREIESQQCHLEVFVQINTGAEPQKTGILPENLASFLEEIASLKLNLAGLMCIPPVNEEPSLHFALLKKLADRHGFARLSMGMSHDFETAIAFGATDVRVGSAIFGARPE